MGHRFPPSLLREYDLRGRVGETLREEDALALGRAVAAMARAKGRSRLVVGYDGRLSSPALERALVEGLVRSGIVVTRLGRGPTPLLYFAIQQLALDGGIMVTGSHNPPDENGFKIVLGPEPFQGACIARLGEIAEAGEFVEGIGKVEDAHLHQQYVIDLASEVQEERGLSVAWDSGNGATGEIVSELARKLPGQHLLLNVEIDGRFPSHHPDPTVPRNLRQLQAAVCAKGCDLGIAFDGDGDRIGVVDGEGVILWADQLMILFAEAVLKEWPGAPIVADVKASQTLFDGIAAAGGRPILSASGYTVIRSRMLAERAPLAGEMSGHIFFAEGYYGFDDAIYVGVRLLDILARTEQSLDAMIDALPAVFNTPELRVECDEARKFAIVGEVKERLRRRGAEFIDIDGVRVGTPDGWWLMRASNTQAVIVVRAEAGSQEGLGRLKQQLTAELAPSGLALPAY
jgi:phosphomannomutase